MVSRPILAFRLELLTSRDASNFLGTAAEKLVRFYMMYVRDTLLIEKI